MMTDELREKKKKCKAIIHGAAAAAAGVGTGLAQIPLADNVALTSIQIPMIISIGQVFDIKVSKSTATAFLSGAAAATVGRSVSQVLWGWIPVAGNAINTATAAGLTELIGWMAFKEFSKMEPQKLSESDELQKEPDDRKYKEFKKRADPFLNRTKDPRTYAEELGKLINDIEEEMWGNTDERLKKLFDDLNNLRF